jgi:hypothetical protein
MHCGHCFQAFHSSCLSEEGEDGSLCIECRQECTGCTMSVLRDEYQSNHLIACPYGGSVYRCPDEQSPYLQCTHVPQIFNCFTLPEVTHLRQEITHVSSGEHGVFNVSGLEHVAEYIGNRVAPILRALPDIETYKFRMCPTEHDGVDLHMDLDYILNHMQDADICLSCNGTLSDKQIRQQRGLHLNKRCKKVPRVARAFTIAGNIGPESIAFLSFGPACVATTNASGMIIPVITSRRTTVVPCLLKPGEIVVFSSNIIHRSTVESLNGNRWSFDMRVILPFGTQDR